MFYDTGFSNMMEKLRPHKKSDEIKFVGAVVFMALFLVAVWLFTGCFTWNIIIFLIYMFMVCLVWITDY